MVGEQLPQDGQDGLVAPHHLPDRLDPDGAAAGLGDVAAEGLAHVAGLAYFGLLLGPVVIGGVTQMTSLPLGLSVVALCAALVAITGPRVLRWLKI